MSSPPDTAADTSEGPPAPSYDPGWNDPPKFVYDPNEATPKVKINLNKRVAFPMTSSTTTPGSSSTKRTTELAPSGLPMPHSKNAPPLMIPSQSTNPELISAPPPALIKPPPTAALINTDSVNELMIPPQTKVPEEEPLSIDELKQRATSAIDFLIKVGGDKFNSQQMEEILSRLEICRKDIETGKLPADVLQLLGKIQEALTSETSDKSQEALHYQQLLMVNHIQVCSLWGPAIKRVISSTIIIKAEPETTTTTSVSDSDEQQQQSHDIDTEQATTRSSVKYFQPQSVDAFLSTPLSPPLIEVANPAISAASSVSEEQETETIANTLSSSPTLSLFQKIKSRILHI